MGLAKAMHCPKPGDIPPLTPPFREAHLRVTHEPDEQGWSQMAPLQTPPLPLNKATLEKNGIKENHLFFVPAPDCSHFALFWGRFCRRNEGREVPMDFALATFCWRLVARPPPGHLCAVLACTFAYLPLPSPSGKKKIIITKKTHPRCQTLTQNSRWPGYIGDHPRCLWSEDTTGAREAFLGVKSIPFGAGVHGCGAFPGSHGGSMAFASLLEHVGGMGRFQVASVLLLALPVLMMASHNLLQNFTAATSDHRCRLRWEANATGLDPQDLLRVSVPRGERCRRFVTPQWWLLEANGSAPNSSWPETEPCHDGWTYDRSVFTSTIITEVGRQQQGGGMWGSWRVSPNPVCSSHLEAPVKGPLSS